MTVRKPKSETPGVYIDIRDRTGRRKRESLTIDLITPKQAKAELMHAVRTAKRKAG